MRLDGALKSKKVDTTQKATQVGPLAACIHIRAPTVEAQEVQTNGERIAQAKDEARGERRVPFRQIQTAAMVRAPYAMSSKKKDTKIRPKQHGALSFQYEDLALLSEGKFLFRQQIRNAGSIFESLKLNFVRGTSIDQNDDRANQSTPITPSSSNPHSII